MGMRGLRKGSGSGRFDRLLNALNRLPRPAFALGTLGFFAFAMASPDAFAVRMTALTAVPQPLWWLLGGVVSFHFGAREAYYLRTRDEIMPSATDAAIDAAESAPNPALRAMRAGQT